MYNILQYTFSQPINQEIEVPVDYKILGISNYYTTGAITQSFNPNTNPVLNIAVNYDSIGTVNLNFFSVKGGEGTIGEVDNDATFIGSYSITDDSIYSLWVTEDFLEKLPPTDYEGLDLISWYSADKGMNREITGEVTQWEDNSNDAVNFYQNNGLASCPIYNENQINGLPSLSFEGNDYLKSYLTSSFDDLSTGFSWFFVVKPDSLNYTPGRLLTLATGATSINSLNLEEEYFDEFKGKLIFNYYDNTDTLHSLEANIVRENQYQLIEVLYNGTDTLYFYINGELAAFGSLPPITSASRIYNFIGINETENNNQFYGDIAEILLYKGFLNAANRQLVEAYCNNKYQLGKIAPEISPPGINIESNDNVQVYIKAPSISPIFYTLDATEPTTASNSYDPEAGFNISRNTVVKAKILGKFGPSNTDTAVIVMGTGGA